jgi:hypothetical protein
MSIKIPPTVNKFQSTVNKIQSTANKPTIVVRPRIQVPAQTQPQVKLLGEFTGPTGIRFFDLRYGDDEKYRVMVSNPDTGNLSFEFVRQRTDPALLESMTYEKMAQLFNRVHYELFGTTSVVKWYSNVVEKAQQDAKVREAEQAEIDDDIQEEIERKGPVAQLVEGIAHIRTMLNGKQPFTTKLDDVSQFKGRFDNVDVSSPHSFKNMDATQRKLATWIEAQRKEAEEDAEAEKEERPQPTFEIVRPTTPTIDSKITKRNKSNGVRVKIEKVYTLVDGDDNGRYFDIRALGQLWTFRLEVQGMHKAHSRGQALQIEHVEGGDLDTLTDEAWDAIVRVIEAHENLPVTQVEALLKHRNHFTDPAAMTPFDPDFPLFESNQVPRLIPEVTQWVDKNGRPRLQVRYGVGRYNMTLEMLPDGDSKKRRPSLVWEATPAELTGDEVRIIEDAVYEYVKMPRAVVTKSTLAMRQMAQIHEEMGLAWMTQWLENAFGERWQRLQAANDPAQIEAKFSYQQLNGVVIALENSRNQFGPEE